MLYYRDVKFKGNTMRMFLDYRKAGITAADCMKDFMRDYPPDDGYHIAVATEKLLHKGAMPQIHCSSKDMPAIAQKISTLAKNNIKFITVNPEKKCYMINIKYTSKQIPDGFYKFENGELVRIGD